MNIMCEAVSRTNKNQLRFASFGARKRRSEISATPEDEAGRYAGNAGGDEHILAQCIQIILALCKTPVML